MNTKIYSAETMCSNRCWNCILKGTPKCHKSETELRPIKNPFRIYHRKWERRTAKSMVRRFVYAFNHKNG